MSQAIATIISALITLTVAIITGYVTLKQAGKPPTKMARIAQSSLDIIEALHHQLDDETKQKLRLKRQLATCLDRQISGDCPTPARQKNTPQPTQAKPKAKSSRKPTKRGRQHDP